MLSLTKYVEWMAFVSFDEHIFDVMDSIILAQFAYLDMKDVWQQEPMKIRDLIEKQSSYSMQMVPDGQDHDDFIKMVVGSVSILLKRQILIGVFRWRKKCVMRCLSKKNIWMF